MGLLNIGYGNAINPNRVVAAVSADSAPARRMVNAAREKNAVVDASCGKKTRTVFIMDSGHIILSAKNIRGFVKDISAEESDEV
ncbi:MAG: DUF370 domain-containing protein [Oscillospiraceae bacterium]|jgi:regulator of extracellular matrix RemA (YlzA/DUF370 family)|nr:DUF370 domain-containing protein [Oscillospiraceae bacterium]